MNHLYLAPPYAGIPPLKPVHTEKPEVQRVNGHARDVFCDCYIDCNIDPKERDYIHKSIEPTELYLTARL